MAYSFHPYPLANALQAAVFGIIASILLFLVRDGFGSLLVIALALVWALALLAAIFSFIRAHFQTLTLEENTLSYTTGILSSHRIVLPFSKISEASFSQSLAERIVGIGTIVIDTPGGATQVIRVPSVRYADIKRVMDEINRKSHHEEN